MKWSPRPAETVSLLAVGLGLGLAALFTDAAGRLLVGGSAAFVLGLALRDALVRPRLSAGRDGVVVRTLGGVRRLPWSQLQARTRTVRRLGLWTRTLELDTSTGPDDDGVLVVLARRDLGADPDDVLRRLRALDPTAGPAAD